MPQPPPSSESKETTRSPFHISNKIRALKESEVTATSSLFSLVDNLFVNSSSPTLATSISQVHLDEKALQSIVSTRPESFALTLPDQKIVSLLRHNPFAPGFYVETKSIGVLTDDTYDAGVHYRGILNDAESSSVSLSFYQNGEVLGSFSTNAQQHLLAPNGSEAPKGEHVYLPEDTRQHFGKECHTPDDPSLTYSAAELAGPEFELAAEGGKCVRQYVVARYEIFQQKGNNRQTVINYITSLMNQSFTLYANDGVSMKLQGLYVYDVPDPFSGTTTSDLLASFQTNVIGWPGDVAQLLGLQGNGGVAAGFSGLCNPNRSAAMCYSGISLTYNNLPAFSWSVYVVTHEIGHCGGGLRHSMACVWNGNNTAIDGCAPVEGNCPRPGLPPNGGIVMSYCHLLPTVGVNFSEGFGIQMRNAMLSRIAASPCLQNCDDVKPLPVLAVNPLTLNFQASSGGPNPNNQSLSITNAGGSTLTWTAAENVAWLGLSATSGTAPSSIAVSVNVAGLNAGSYSGVINLTSPSGGSKAVTVTLTVTGTNPSPCQGGTIVNGTLDYKGDRVYLSIYQTTTVAAQQISLNSSVLGSDFELGLLQYTASTQKWAQVASSTGPTSTESITYTGPAGYYAPYVESYTGNGPFTACVKVPAGTTTTNVQIPKGLPVGLLMVQTQDASPEVEAKEKETESSPRSDLEAGFLQLERDLRDPSHNNERLLARIECLKVATALRLLYPNPPRRGSK